QQHPQVQLPRVWIVPGLASDAQAISVINTAAFACICAGAAGQDGAGASKNLVLLHHQSHAGSFWWVASSAFECCVSCFMITCDLLRHEQEQILVSSLRGCHHSTRDDHPKKQCCRGSFAFTGSASSVKLPWQSIDCAE
ncbi:TPA: hypothetical protein N0F65_010554, partial [Lagenidium giganteum]